MIIDETHECNSLTVKADRKVDFKQFGEWIQIDKQQAQQLVTVLQKWLNGEAIE